jgi:hypothetical protein
MRDDHPNDLSTIDMSFKLDIYLHFIELDVNEVGDSIMNSYNRNRGHKFAHTLLHFDLNFYLQFTLILRKSFFYYWNRMLTDVVERRSE